MSSCRIDINIVMVRIETNTGGLLVEMHPMNQGRSIGLLAFNRSMLGPHTRLGRGLTTIEARLTFLGKGRQQAQPQRSVCSQLEHARRSTALPAALCARATSARCPVISPTRCAPHA